MQELLVSLLKEKNRALCLGWHPSKGFFLKEKPFFFGEKTHIANRELLVQVFKLCIQKVQKEGIDFIEANRFVRGVWNQEYYRKKKRPLLPHIVSKDTFLYMYAEGSFLTVAHLMRIWKALAVYKEFEGMPIYPEWNALSPLFFDVDATPPGLLPKIFLRKRIEKDQDLLTLIGKDLALLARLADLEKRRFLALAILSHAAAYRELEEKVLHLPHFLEQTQELIPYRCHQHLIGEGVKTISLTPLVSSPEIPGIYLCQGTEIWPSQPSVLGSILANLGRHGSATEVYAHSWRRIHKHLRLLKRKSLPLVAGHSMGGALAIQIALYSHHFIKKAYAYNAPVPNERDKEFYLTLDREARKKLEVHVNLDDFAFWRIGDCVVGNVFLYLGEKRWRYQPVSLMDCLFFFPALIKLILNVRKAFPAHQNIFSLYQSSVKVPLSEEEIREENQERLQRFDHLHFLPKFYKPFKKFLFFIRKHIKWDLQEQYLRNEIELVCLHEQDLHDAMTEENHAKISRELEKLKRQKEMLQKKLYRLI